LVLPTYDQVVSAANSTNPEALPDAPPPRVHRIPIRGTDIYAETRGAGPAVLIVPGGAEDAEGWRPVSERLPHHLVVTYDRRGTLRSGREEWPGQGSAQHADDADALLDALEVGDALVFGASSGGIIALELAIRHPARVRRALVFEPGYFGNVPGGKEFQRTVGDAVARYLNEHADDWPGAYEAFLRAVAGPAVTDDAGFLTPPPGREWYAGRERLNAEALVRDDLPILTREVLDVERLASASVDIRFAHGAESAPLFRDISEHLAAVKGVVADRIEGVGHAIYFHPASVAAYIQDCQA
jgi:pimeloyl-ACP methyl ester carboxylesterase